MSNFKILGQSLDLIESKIESLTADQMHNAMVKICLDIAPSFGKSWTEFRTWHFEPSSKPNESAKVVYDPCTKEQLLAYVADKREMLKSHPYVAA